MAPWPSQPRRLLSSHLLVHICPSVPAKSQWAATAKRAQSCATLKAEPTSQPTGVEASVAAKGAERLSGPALRSTDDNESIQANLDSRQRQRHRQRDHFSSQRDSRDPMSVGEVTLKNHADQREQRGAENFIWFKRRFSRLCCSALVAPLEIRATSLRLLLFELRKWVCTSSAGGPFAGLSVGSSQADCHILRPEAKDPAQEQSVRQCFVKTNL